MILDCDFVNKNETKNADICESVSILILLCLGAIILVSDTTTTLFFSPCVSLLTRSSPFSYVFVFLFCFFNQNKKTRT